MINEKLKKSIYNYRYTLKKLNPKSKILDTKPNELKSNKVANDYVNTIYQEIGKERVKRLYKTNRKLALQKHMGLEKLGSSKYYDLKIQYEKEFNPNVKQNTLKKLYERYKKALSRESGIRTNNFGLTLTRDEIKQFYKSRDKANKKLTKLLNKIKDNDSGLYDYINGTTRKGFKIGEFNPTRDGWLIVTKPKFKEILGSGEYKFLMNRYNKINDKDFNLYSYYNQGRENLLQIFNSNRYLNIDDSLLKEFNNYARSMDIPAFMAWYTNNKIKIEDYYLNSKYETVGVGLQDLKEELENVVNEMRAYQNQYNKVYKS